METMIHNPILKGFHPDPSICRVGDDYYLATSTFHWFPGVEIHHSRDLVNWELINRPLDEERLIDMTGTPDSGGVWAPCLSYDEGLFYLAYSNVKTFHNYYKDVDNYLTVSSSIMGPWSDLIYLNSSGFDPSMFHDSDGRKYVLNLLWDHRDCIHQFDGIVLQEYDKTLKKLVGEPVKIFAGSDLGFTEGPHLYKVNGLYHLICAEGGTFYGHAATMARASDIRGPYELSPYHPLLSTRDHPDQKMQKCGHGSLVETQNGEWYIFHLCGRPNGTQQRCMLGRETAVQKARLTDEGWFVLDSESGLPEELVKPPQMPPFTVAETPEKLVFPGSLPKEFQTLRRPLNQSFMSFNEERQALILYGKESMESLHMQSLVGIRRTDFYFEAETKLRFEPIHYQQMAGLSLYYDTTNYFYLNLSWDENEGRVLTLVVCDHGSKKISGTPHPLETDQEFVLLKMVVRNAQASFWWSADGADYQSIGEVLDASQLSDDYYDEEIHGLRFTGTFVTLSCQDTSGRRWPAEFEYLKYKALD